MQEALYPFEHALAASGLAGAPLDSVFRRRDWGDARTVRAAFLADLLTEPAELRGVVLTGALITGVVDLEACRIARPVLLQQCRFEQPVNLKEAKAEAIRFRTCFLPALVADQLEARELRLEDSRVHVVSLVAARIRDELSLRATRVLGGHWPVDLDHATRNPPGPPEIGPAACVLAINAERLDAGAVSFDRTWTHGEVRLIAAQVQRLTCNGARMTGLDSDLALNADGINVAQDMLFWPDDSQHPFRADGQIRLVGARARTLSLIGAQLDSGALDRPALVADGMAAEVGIYMNDDFCARGGITLRAVRTGVLSLKGAEVTQPGGAAVEGERLVARSGVFCEGLKAVGTVSLADAEITGELNLAGARLDGSGGPSLVADRVRVNGSLFAKRLRAERELLLRGGHITGLVNLDEITIRNPAKPVLRADQLQADSGMSCRRATLDGRTMLPGARIRGRLRMESARFYNPGKIALDAPGLTVDRGIFASNLDATGELALGDTKIGGQLKLTGATLRGDCDHTALNLDGAQVGHLSLRLCECPAGSIDLAGARIGTLDIRPQTGDWAPCCKLSDCTYESLITKRRTSAQIGWLAADPNGFSAQPYEQLAAWYRQQGRDAEARRVAIARHRTRRRRLRWRRRGFSKLWSSFLDVTVGYGYRPWQAGIWLVALVIAGSLLFGTVFDAYGNDVPQPRRAEVVDLNPARPPDQVPHFQPIIYSVDLLIPVVSMGQKLAWNPRGPAQWTAFLLTVCGWLLTTALIADVATRRQ